MLARGVSLPLTASLIRAGLAADQVPMRRGRGPRLVARVRITDAGRQVLAERGPQNFDQEPAVTLGVRGTLFIGVERRPDEYEIVYNGKKVGRMYRMNDTWQWVGLRVLPRGRNSGAADSFDEAKAAFQATWEAHCCGETRTEGVNRRTAEASQISDR
jgi:hypothetical protein